MINAKTIFDDLPGAGGGSKIPVGIHEGCSVASIEVGDNYIDFNYEDVSKRVHNKRVWFPDDTKVYKRDGEGDQEAITRDLNERLAEIVKHMSIFMDAEDIGAFAAPTFDAFAKKAKATLTPLLGNEKVNLKLTYDKEGMYSELSRYGYIEKYVEDSAPTLSYSKWERANRLEYKGASAGPSTDDTPASGPSTESLY